jgi:hypothetical protein
MSNITIPPELSEYLDRMHYLLNQLRKLNDAGIDMQRHSLLERLLKVECPTELEKNLIKEISTAEDKCRNDKTAMKDSYREEFCELREKVRKVCRDMFVGKYVKLVTYIHIIYMRVDQVTMGPEFNGTVYIEGQAVSFCRENGEYQWTERHEHYIFTVSEIIDSVSDRAEDELNHRLSGIYLITRDDVLHVMDEYKKNMMERCDNIIEYVQEMEGMPLSEDKPVNSSKWW